MPPVKALKDAEIAFLYTNIGRGHPGYLDGIIDAITQTSPEIRYFVTDVFALSRGISLLGWRSVDGLYRFGARGGIISSTYGFLRRFSGGGSGRGAALRILAGHIRLFFKEFTGLVVVAHPLLARMLSGQNRVVYQHGELAVPDESLVTGCECILVPLENTADVFRRKGVNPESICVTGQCIEVGLLSRAESAFHMRLKRLQSSEKLSIALFTSGAYPADHLAKLRMAALALTRAGHNLFIFMGLRAQQADRFRSYLERQGVEVSASSTDSIPVKIFHATDRAAYNQKAFEVFDRIDLFIAPAHERTNWAVGLGLPHFVLTPHIGSYAPLNARIERERQVAVEIENKCAAADIANLIDRLREGGDLVKMARNGWGQTTIDGFERCRQILCWVADKKTTGR